LRRLGVEKSLVKFGCGDSDELLEVKEASSAVIGDMGVAGEEELEPGTES